MTITIQTSPNSISKAIAFIIVTVGAAYLLHLFDIQELAEISYSPPTVYIQAERELHQNGLVFDFFYGAFYWSNLSRSGGDCCFGDTKDVA